jgi:hypothetical protein
MKNQEFFTDAGGSMKRIHGICIGGNIFSFSVFINIFATEDHLFTLGIKNIILLKLHLITNC